MSHTATPGSRQQDDELQPDGATDPIAVDGSVIRFLPDLLINKIAAGEVIERPSSLAKELLDNAIDAGATRISLTMEDGGKKLLRVSDDGCGMGESDLRMAVQPHTTSKLTCEEDLYSIDTMGFRGEALASISAVSKMRLTSRPHDSQDAHEIFVSGKTIESSKATGSPVGTTVEVRDLFFNVPARRKFLRANATEVGHINEQVARAALANPHIAFKVTNNGRVTQNLPASQSRLERIANFYGQDLATALLAINREERGLSIEAYAAPPSQSRANTNWQYVFVNNRYIRDRYVQHAIKEAYRGLLEPNRCGVVFVFISIDPLSVDVNVHPTKIEVRWSDPNLIHSQMLSVLRETFQRCDITPVVRTTKAETDSGFRRQEHAQQDQFRHDMADLLKNAKPLTSDSPRAFGGGGAEFRPGGFSSGGQPSSNRGPVSSSEWRALYEPASQQGSTPSPDAAGNVYQVSNLRAVQLHNMFLVTETEDGIAIIDQHALHERIMYERLKARITQGSLESQRLLLPETVSVTPDQAAVVESHAELFSRIGVEVTSFGSDSIAVHSFPVLLKNANVGEFVRDLLDELVGKPTSLSTEEAVSEVLDMMSCKAAIKAGDPLTPEEIEALLREKETVAKSSSCPHGRPTTLKFSMADLHRQFKRT